jgi:hypothetical protein
VRVAGPDDIYDPGPDVSDLWYACDYETTTYLDPDNGRVRVWSWAIAPIDSDVIYHGTTIEAFVDRAAELGGIMWFHNLRFDGGFLDAYLLSPTFGLGMRSGRWPKRQTPAGSFSALIGDTGAHYSRYVHLRDGRTFEVRDSAKKYPSTSIAMLASMYGAPTAKGTIDYQMVRPIGYQPTAEEWEYQDADVIILRTALRVTRAAGALGLTVGGDALTEFKSLMRQGKFRQLFPVLDRDTDDFIRRALRGGWTFVNPLHQAVVLNMSGEVYDVNSMYPAVMRQSSYPVGVPVPLAPGQTELLGYPHVMYGAVLDAQIKTGRLPMIQIRGDARYNPVDYQTRVEGVEWYGTEVDWALLHDQYDVTIHEWAGGLAFRGMYGLFDEYIDKWMEVKEENGAIMAEERDAGRVGSERWATAAGLRTQSKFSLNNLWGRFAINPLRAGRIPDISDEGTPLYPLTDAEYGEPTYTPVGVWTTSYGRDRVIRAAQTFGDDFLMADTDSIHKLGAGAGGLEIHETKLGAWKRESEFTKATYLRAKSYAELIDGEVETHVAGLPRVLVDNKARAEKGLPPFRVEDVRVGTKLSGKLIPKRVPGGIILESTDFEIGEKDAWGHGR